MSLKKIHPGLPGTPPAAEGASGDGGAARPSLCGQRNCVGRVLHRTGIGGVHGGCPAPCAKCAAIERKRRPKPGDHVKVDVFIHQRLLTLARNLAASEPAGPAIRWLTPRTWSVHHEPLRRDAARILADLERDDG